MLYNKATKYILAAAGIATISTAAYAVNFTGSRLDDFRNVDEDNGGTVTQNARFLGSMTFKITTARASRAELRREGQKSGVQSMGGNFRLVSADSGADRLSIIQALTVKADNAETGGADVNTQLAIRRSGNEWEFYNVQQSGQPDCTDIKFKVGDTLNIKITYEDNKQAIYTIRKGTDTKTCSGGETIGVGDKFYYGKLGVYATGSGSGKATVNWSSISD